MTHAMALYLGARAVKVLADASISFAETYRVIKKANQ